MAAGKGSDFKIYNEEFFGGMNEVLTQEANVFNAASANGMQLITNLHRGDYEKESFLKNLATVVTSRDVTSIASAADTAMTQDEIIAVKVARKIGPVAQTLDAWKKIAVNPQEMSFLLGQQTAKAVLLNKVNSGIKSAACAMRYTDVNFDGTGTVYENTMSHLNLIGALAMFGDASQRIRCWVMHSKPYFDLLAQGIADNVTNIADGVIRVGTIPAIGKPIIVTDAADLKVAGTPDTYWTLGLVEGGVVIMDSEEETIESQIITGLENLVMRIQGEFAFSIKIKGYKWVTTAGANPTDGALALAGNWANVATDFKDTAGVRLKTE